MTSFLETERLFFREMNTGDLDFVAAMLSHPDVMRYYPQRFTREGAAAWIERQQKRYATDGHGLWLVVSQSTGEPIGQVGVTVQMVDEKPQKEIGYLIHYPFWRQGYAAEAAIAVRDYTFTKLDCDHVISLIRPINKPSQGVARKMGMQPGQETLHANLSHIIFSVDRFSHEKK